MKKITLCADDYGQNESISQAIITLLAKKRLSATSCMTTADFWPDSGQQLLPYAKEADIGLHFNLTEGRPLSNHLGQPTFIPLLKLIGLAHARLLKVNTIENELNAQLDAFENVMGKLPDFIDGHQHIHQLPVIRTALLNVYQQRLKQNGSYIRCVYQPFFSLVKRSSYPIKTFIIQGLSGGRQFKNLLTRHNIPHNLSFGGIYTFKSSRHYSFLFKNFLHESAAEKSIIMCHPGKFQVGDGDAISHARSNEYLYLNSEQFLKDCDAANAQLVQFKKQ